MPALTAIARKGVVRIEKEPVRVNAKTVLPQFMEGNGQLLGVMINQRLSDPLLKSFTLQRPLLVNLVLAVRRSQALQTLEVTLRSELGAQLGLHRAAEKRHPTFGATSPGIASDRLKLRKAPKAGFGSRLSFPGPFHVTDKLRGPPLLATYL